MFKFKISKSYSPINPSNFFSIKKPFISALQRNFTQEIKSPPWASSKIIFCEDHLDSASLRMLKALAQKLKKLKYHKFCDEVKKNTTLETNASQFSKRLMAFADLAEDFKELKLDINDERQVEFYVRFKAAKVGLDEDSTERELATIQYLIKRAPVIEVFLEFLNVLKANRMSYSGIDIDVDEALKSKSYKGIHDPALIELRDSTMVDSYLSSSEPVVGRIGLGHLVGIQSAILQKLPLEIAQKAFRFVYAYSQPPNSQGEEKLRNKEVLLPIELILINLTGVKDENLENIFIEKMEESQRKLDLEDKLNHPAPKFRA